MKDRFNRLRLQTKILSGSALLLLLLCSMALLVFQNIRASQEREQWVSHTHQVIGGIDHLLLQLVNMETGYRGYLLAGNQEFLQPYNEGLGAYWQDLTALRMLVSDNPAQQSRLDQIDVAVRAWQTKIVFPGLRLRQELTADRAAPTALQTYSTSNSGKADFDALRTVIAQFREVELDLLEQRSLESQAAARKLQVVLVGGALLALLTGLGSAIAISRGIAQRVGQVVYATTRFGQGQFDENLPLPDGTDELAELAGSFKTMAATIKQQLVALQEERAQSEAARAVAEQAHAQIAAQLATIDQQHALIREMSVPILPVNDHMLVMPLIGALDTSRLELVREQALQAIQERNARFLLLDITGVPVVDTAVAKALVGVVQASRLLGAETILVGIRPEVAQALVGLGLRLEQVRTQPTLQAGIAEILRTYTPGPLARRAVGAGN